MSRTPWVLTVAMPARRTWREPLAGAIRPFVPCRRSRIVALVAVIALLLAAPFERRRACDVCPVDCPMHAGAHGRGVGCHHGKAGASARRPADDGACAMRASCGHHDYAAVTFHAELPPSIMIAGLAVRPLRRPPAFTAHVADGPLPPDRPPKPFVV